MTQKERAAMQQALIYLDAIINGEGVKPYQLEGTAFTLREALAEQAEQEPVAWALSHSMGLEFGSKYPIQETKEAAEQMARQHMGAVVVTPLYAAPVRTKDLTDDEIEAIRIGIIAYEPTGYGRVFARAVIAADREKNK